VRKMIPQGQVSDDDPGNVTMCRWQDLGETNLGVVKRQGSDFIIPHCVVVMDVS
jgi:hypothetical protein